MKRRIAACALTLAALGVAGSTIVGAEPADQSPIGGHRAHPHHVHTGSGGCHDLDQHLFEPQQEGEARHRGLHQGALQGRVHHGTCVAGPHL